MAINLAHQPNYIATFFLLIPAYTREYRPWCSGRIHQWTSTYSTPHHTIDPPNGPKLGALRAEVVVNVVGRESLLDNRGVFVCTIHGRLACSFGVLVYLCYRGGTFCDCGLGGRWRGYEGPKASKAGISCTYKVWFDIYASAGQRGITTLWGGYQ